MGRPGYRVQPDTAAMTASASTKPSTESTRRARENERPLTDDIRLLGRILGDVIRDQDPAQQADVVGQGALVFAGASG